MDLTEKTIKEFFRTVGQQSAGYRLVDHLRAENLMLVPAAEFDMAAETRSIENYTGKKPRERRQDRT